MLEIYSSCFKIHGAGHASVTSRSGCSRAKPIVHTSSGIKSIDDSFAEGFYPRSRNSG
ncbi:MAG: hypothetical protein LBJ00_18630 [Planctomycetaceae bacterium]|nr:hypothetical protein [Planctomycetaceae bacterium]